MTCHSEGLNGASYYNVSVLAVRIQLHQTAIRNSDMLEYRRVVAQYILYILVLLL
jgi:hypothetical protein